MRRACCSALRNCARKAPLTQNATSTRSPCRAIPRTRGWEGYGRCTPGRARTAIASESGVGRLLLLLKRWWTEWPFQQQVSLAVLDEKAGDEAFRGALPRVT